MANNVEVVVVALCTCECSDTTGALAFSTGDPYHNGYISSIDELVRVEVSVKHCTNFGNAGPGCKKDI